MLGCITSILHARGLEFELFSDKFTIKVRRVFLSAILMLLAVFQIPIPLVSNLFIIFRPVNYDFIFYQKEITNT